MSSSGQERIASVVVDLSLDRLFDYLVPSSLTERIVPGVRVKVPFGHRTCEGYVVAVDGKPAREGLRALTECVDDLPLLTPATLKLAEWIASYYQAPLSQVIRTVLPGPVRSNRSGFKTCLCAFPVEPDAAAAPGLSDKQAHALTVVRNTPGIPLTVAMKWAGCSRSPLQSLAKAGLIRIEEERQRRDPLAQRRVLPTRPLDLMPEQAEALRGIVDLLPGGGGGQNADSTPRSGCGAAVESGAVCADDAASPTGRKPNTILLYGVTGSGKTEVYLQALAACLARGLGAIVLVPEISLTPQTIARFRSRFGDIIAVLHSHLSDGERHDEWHRIRRGEARVVIGARSAIFAPVERPGLILVDEEHESSYKQSEAPRYHARDVAVMRGHMENCPVVLGSATPALESWMNACRGKYGRYDLPRRADEKRMPVVHIVDMRIETERNQRMSVFSQVLLDAMQQRLDRREQTILFLNRRGFASSMLCPACGYVFACEACSVSLTYHRRDQHLQCHICGACAPVPDKCPACGDSACRFSGMGTERVEGIVQKCFPGAVTGRLDRDVTVAKDAYERILDAFRAGEIDILVGTQMIAKGLHFPKVTLVGVIYADLSLHVPDFRAAERTFQLLAQVAGRAGRGAVTGEVMIQTYTPRHAALEAARIPDYEAFAAQELPFRRELGYPPYGRMICLTFRGPNETRVTFCAEQVQRALTRMAPELNVSEVMPAPLTKMKRDYRYQILLRGSGAGPLGRVVRQTLGDVTLPRDVQCAVDVDPVSMT